MIVETIIAGLTVMYVCSLAFANHQIKRQRESKFEDSSTKFTLAPFIKVVIDTPCPKCLTPSKNAVVGNKFDCNLIVKHAQGLGVPEACFDEKCKANKFCHLHVECYTCKNAWLMAPADSEVKKKE